MKTAAEFSHLVHVRTESAEVDFKSQFEVEDDGHWLEVIKDIVAMVNSGGGLILFGVHDDGTPSELECQPILGFDTSRITAKVRRWTGIDLADVALIANERNGCRIAALAVGGREIPIGFTKDGQYEANGETKFAFRQGQFFFRHGAKSEPGTTSDLCDSIDRKLASVREEWLGNIRKVFEAPPGSQFTIVAPYDAQGGNPVASIRIVNDESADPHRLIHSDDSHPLRQCDVIREVNERLGPNINIHQRHLQDIRRVHRIEEKSQFHHKGRLPGAPRQFSQAFVDWIVESFRNDPGFFQKARQARKALAAARNDARGERAKTRELAPLT